MQKITEFAIPYEGADGRLGHLEAVYRKASIPSNASQDAVTRYGFYMCAATCATNPPRSALHLHEQCRFVQMAAFHRKRTQQQLAVLQSNSMIQKV